MTNPIVLFDGECNLCNFTVQWIIKRDTKNQFRFCAQQNEIGQNLLSKHSNAHADLSTVILIFQDKVYTHSQAVIQIGIILGSWYRLAYILKVIPRFFRDKLYIWVSKNRYKWFGKKDSCMIPSQELKNKFLI